MPRLSAVLSIAQVRALVKKGGTYAVGGVKGLSVVSQQGRTPFYMLRLSKDGKESRIKIGDFALLSLKEAREKATGILADIQRGTFDDGTEPPTDDKPDVASLLCEWLDEQVERKRWKDSTARGRDHLRQLEKHVIPNIQGWEIDKVTAIDVAKLLRPLWCDHPKQADYLRGLLSLFFVWTMVVRKVRPIELGNPAATELLREILPPERERKKGSHYPFLPPEKVPAFMAALRRRPGAVARCTELAILTCTRSSNIRLMKWADVDLERRIWTIPAEEMKVERNGVCEIPLSDRAVEILEEMRFLAPLKWSKEYVFASHIKGRVVSENSLNKLIVTLHEIEVHEGREGWIDPDLTKERGEPVIACQHAIARASFRTWATATPDFSDRVIELCLHHAVSKYAGAYDRAKLLDEKKALMQAWSDFCKSAPRVA